MKKTTILALSWRDITSPKAGGAEVHTHEMLSRADKDKFKIVHFAATSKGQAAHEEIDGVMYVRHGNVLVVIPFEIRYYRRHHTQIDFVIDQCNTHRFFTPLWVESSKRIFYIHQLTKEIWDYSARFPLSKIGKALEESFLMLNRHDLVIRVSESTRDELAERGYDRNRIQIIHNGVSFRSWKPDEWRPKEACPALIYAGRYSPYKGIDVAVKELPRVKKDYPDTRLWILGKKDQDYVDKDLMPICRENHLAWEDAMDDNPTGDIVSWGYVSEERKLELLSRAWVLLFSQSEKDGESPSRRPDVWEHRVLRLTRPEYVMRSTMEGQACHANLYGYF